MTVLVIVAVSSAAGCGSSTTKTTKTTSNLPGTATGTTVSHPPTPQLAITPNPGDYGHVPVGHEGSQTFTLANPGGSATGALTITVSPTPPFTITANTCRGALPPSGSCTVTVRFAPTESSPASATLTAAGTRAEARATTDLTGNQTAHLAHLYWAESRMNRIWRANLDGTGVTTIITNHPAELGPHPQSFEDPRWVAADSSRVYWTSYWSHAGASGYGGQVSAANPDGARVTTLVPGDVFGPSGVYAQPGYVAVSGSHIYWTYRVVGGASTTIMAANPDGTGVTTLITHQESPGGLAVYGSHIYWTSGPGGSRTINRANLDGTGVTTLGTLPGNVGGLAVYGSHIYWVDSGYRDGTINRANLDGTGVTTLVHGQEYPLGVVVYGSHIYWTTDLEGDIMAANLDGTGVTRLVRGQDGPIGIAVGP